MIIKCGECGKDVSTEASACPSCGYPQKPQVIPSQSKEKGNNAHIFGWIALISFLLSSFTPAILASLIVLVAIIFSLLEIKQGGKIFGSIAFAFSLVQAFFIMDHFSGISGAIGLTNTKEIEQKIVKSYSAEDSAPPSNVEQIIQQKCSEEWAGDYKMKSYCQEQQQEGLQKIRQQIPSDISIEASKIIRGKCAKEWPRDFQMRAHCESQQIEAYRTLATSNVNSSSNASCAQQWPDDYKMRQYCESKK